MASATKSKHTTLSMTPEVKRSSRLTVRSDGLWTAAASAPPRASPPTPVSVVMVNIIVYIFIGLLPVTNFSFSV